MNVYESLFTPNAMINEEVAREVFENMPERPLVVFTDGMGRSWSNDEEGLQRIDLNCRWIDDICGRIADGAEPVIAERNGWGIFGAAVSVEDTTLGYLLIVIERQSPEAMLSKTELAEALLCQVNQVAKLVIESRKLKSLNLKMADASRGAALLN